MRDLKEKLFTAIEMDLSDIERALKQNLSPYLDIVSEVAHHIIFSGGKRLRPLLFLLSARICGYDVPKVKTLSPIFEYLHTATLLHDDIVDGASLRRGKQVANSIWGSATAVLVGDFLLARSSSLAVESGYLEVVGVLADISENMSQGEIHQLLKKGDLNINEDEYLDIIHCKTAVLFQGACRVGAIVAEASEEKRKALSDYGLHLGTAFQLVDDLIDYTSDTVTMGKEFGADLKEGKLTMPVIHALNAARSFDRIKMEKIIANAEFSLNDFKTLLQILKKYNGIAYTQKRAAEFIEHAKQALTVFDESETKNTLFMIADYTLERNA